MLYTYIQEENLEVHFLKCSGETCISKKGHPESILFGSLSFFAMNMTLLQIKVDIIMIITAKFHKNGITFTYMIFT